MMTETKELYLLKLLHLIKNNQSIESLVKLGLDYSQIATLLLNAINDGYILDQETDGLVLTKTGMELFRNLNKHHYPITANDFLLPLDEYRIDKIDKFAVYLPKNKRPLL